VTEFIYQFDNKLINYKTNLYQAITNIFEDLKQFIDLNNSKLKNPTTLLREKSQRLDNIDLRLQQNQKSIIVNRSNEINMYVTLLKNTNPLLKLNVINEKIRRVLNNMNRGVKDKLKTNNNNLEKLYKNIKILNPLSILDRGYAIVTNDKGVALKSSKQVNNGEKLQARLSKGSIEVKVNKVND